MKPLILIILVSLLLINCGSPGVDIDSKKIHITVSILPQKYFVECIVGDNINFDIHVMIPPGHSPATYAPTPQQMKDLGRSQLYMRIGHIPFEKAWINNIAANNPNMKILDTSLGVNLIKFEEEGHDHDRHHDHSHSGIDPHIWLSPQAVKIQAKHILEAVTAIDSDNQAFYKKNYQQFLQDIDGLDREINALLEKCTRRKFMVFHPAWSYFARDYGLEQLPIEIEGKAPSPADLKRIIDIAKQENIGVIFVQEQFDTHSARAVAAEINGRVVKMNPLAPNWLTNMKVIAQTLSSALR